MRKATRTDRQPEVQNRHARRTLNAGREVKNPRSSFGEWLRTLVLDEGPAHNDVLEEMKLEELKRRMSSLLGHLVVRMSRRDLRLYLRLLSADSPCTLHRLRFEYFDLLCRMLSEQVAKDRLREVDALLFR